MKTYKATEMFYDWHSKTDPNLSKEISENRIAALTELTEADADAAQIQFWLDMHRLHLGQKAITDSHLSDFTAKIKEHDITFPLTENDALVKSMASIALCVLFEQEPSWHIDPVALSVKTASFFGQYSIDSKIPVYEKAENYLINSSLTDREFDTEESSKLEDFEEITAARAITPEEQNTIFSLLKSAGSAIKCLSEESNILWWMFGERASISDMHFSEFKPAQFCFVCAKELSLLTLFPTPLIKSRSMLSKALQINTKGKTQKKTSLFEIVNTLGNDIDFAPFKDIATQIFSPCLYIMLQMQSQDKKTEWSTFANRMLHNVDIKTERSTLDFSVQIYTELVLMKILEGGSTE